MPSKHDYHWTFGDGCHLEFQNGGDPIVVGDHKFKSNEGCATISDDNGNLLFYTDGDKLYDGGHVLIGSGLGGGSSSCHSAIIVPPVSGGSLYHVFAVHEWEGVPKSTGPVTHTKVAVTGGGVTINTPTQLPPPTGPQRAGEKLAAIPHRDCGKYWVIALHIDSENIQKSGSGIVYAMLVDSDAGVSLTVPTGYPFPDVYFGMCCKFSPDGRLIAMVSQRSIDILNFDRATGIVTAHSRIEYPPTKQFQWGYFYGVEFSPNGKYLYFTDMFDGNINRHAIGKSGDLPTPFKATDLLGNWPTGGRNNFHTGALQLAPNGKIYGTKVTTNELFEIGDPDSPTATAIGVQLNLTAKAADGKPLLLHKNADLGLPTFTRIADDCRTDDRCRDIASDVDRILNERRSRLVNQMAPCRDETPGQPHEPGVEPPHEPRVEPATGHGLATAAREATLGSHLHPNDPGGTLEPIDPGEPPSVGDPGGSVHPQEPQPQPPQALRCTPLTMPQIRPRTSISWGDSECDCIEGDDTEVMHLTVCNPYSNLTLSNLVVNELVVVDGKGNPVPNLPDGSPSIQLVPIGPYCFDDIAPCTCITREFVLRLRGAPHGAYHIKVRGICFDACFHGDEEACFAFEVCKD